MKRWLRASVPLLASLAPAARGQRAWSLERSIPLSTVNASDEALDIKELLPVSGGIMYAVQVNAAIEGRGILVLDTTGALLSSFKTAEAFTFAGTMRDTLYVVDSYGGTVTWYDAFGRVRRTQRIARIDVELPYKQLHVYHPLADGTLLAIAFLDNGLLSRGNSFPVPIVRAQPDGKVLLRLASTSAGNRGLLLLVDGGQVMVTFKGTMDQFDEHTLYRPFTDRRSLVLVQRPMRAMNDSARFRVVRLNASGDTVFARPFVRMARAVRPEYLDSVVAYHAQFVQRFFKSAAITTQVLRSTMQVGATFPAVAELQVGPDSTIWLKQAPLPDGNAQWLILDHRGVQIGSAVLPWSLRVVLVKKDQLWAHRRSPDGQPFLDKYVPALPDARVGAGARMAQPPGFHR